MADDSRIVAVGTGVELVPQVAHHDGSSKSEVFHLEDVVGCNASEGHDLVVDNPLFACGAQLFGGEAGSHSCLGDAVEYRTQEYIVVEVLLVFQLVDGVAGATDVSCIVVWLLGVAGIQVDAQQVEFVLQVEMLVGDDAPMIFFGNEGQQTFRVHGRRFRLTQVQDVQPFLEEGGDDLVFFHKKCGWCHNDKFHILCRNC